MLDMRDPPTTNRCTACGEVDTLVMARDYALTEYFEINTQMDDPIAASENPSVSDYTPSSEWPDRVFCHQCNAYYQVPRRWK